MYSYPLATVAHIPIGYRHPSFSDKIVQDICEKVFSNATPEPSVQLSPINKIFIFLRSWNSSHR